MVRTWEMQFSSALPGAAAVVHRVHPPAVVRRPPSPARPTNAGCARCRAGLADERLALIRRRGRGRPVRGRGADHAAGAAPGGPHRVPTGAHGESRALPRVTNRVAPRLRLASQECTGPVAPRVREKGPRLSWATSEPFTRSWPTPLPRVAARKPSPADRTGSLDFPRWSRTASVGRPGIRRAARRCPGSRWGPCPLLGRLKHNPSTPAAVHAGQSGVNVRRRQSAVRERRLQRRPNGRPVRSSPRSTRSGLRP